MYKRGDTKRAGAQQCTQTVQALGRRRCGEHVDVTVEHVKMDGRGM